MNEIKFTKLMKKFHLIYSSIQYECVLFIINYKIHVIFKLEAAFVIRVMQIKFKVFEINKNKKKTEEFLKKFQLFEAFSKINKLAPYQ